MSLLTISCSLSQEKQVRASTSVELPTADSTRWIRTLPQRIVEAREFLNSRTATFRQDIAILIDMRISSSKNRLFVIDLRKDSILSSALVAHGSGSELPGTDSLVFSNIPNSYQSSLGKYRIGYSYAGQFGKAYKLYGLDSTNSNAFKRLIVLHRYSCVPDTEQDYPICNSLGCPMVSESFFPVLEKLIDAKPKSMLLWIYYD